MSDPIKEFVEQNRSAFDELDAPTFNLHGFKARIKPVPEKRIPRISLSIGVKILVAASILITLATTFLVLRRSDQQSVADNFVQKNNLPATETTGSALDKKQPALAVHADLQLAKVNPIKKLKKELKKLPLKITSTTEQYQGLSDSSSSSNRLASILVIEKANQMNHNLLDQLAKTLNNDSNSNVRLAALSVINKYSYDVYAASLMLKSLDTQSDPMAQLGLVILLGKMKNLNINDKLYALANDPNTFDAVKDEAYTILLKEDNL